jgi:hypothetical protein
VSRSSLSVAEVVYIRPCNLCAVRWLGRRKTIHIDPCPERFLIIKAFLSQHATVHNKLNSSEKFIPVLVNFVILNITYIVLSLDWRDGRVTCLPGFYTLAHLAFRIHAYSQQETKLCITILDTSSTTKHRVWATTRFCSFKLASAAAPTATFPWIPSLQTALPGANQKMVEDPSPSEEHSLVH